MYYVTVVCIYMSENINTHTQHSALIIKFKTMGGGGLESKYTTVQGYIRGRERLSEVSCGIPLMCQINS